MTTLISIPAGRSFRREGSKFIDAQANKGSIDVTDVDGLVALRWINKGSGPDDDELIIFPGEASFNKVSQDPSGRTHVLAFSSSDQKHFYWFQRASTGSDARDQVDLHEILQNPAYRLGSAPLPETPAAPAAAAPTQTTSAASGSEAAAAPTAGGSQEEMARLIAEWARSGGLSQGGADDDARLTDVMSPANISSLVASKPDLVRTLTPLLPPGLELPSNPTAQDLIPILSAPQFTDAIASLDNALRSGGLPGSMMRELGLPESAGSSVKSFLEALMALGQQGGGGSGDQSHEAMDTD